MQKPGWDPVRRNRYIGTAKQGHGQDNRMVIPNDWRDSRVFWERVSHFTVATRSVHGRELPFVVEPTRQDSVFACTVDDIATLLNVAPSEHVFGVVMRKLSFLFEPGAATVGVNFGPPTVVDP